MAFTKTQWLNKMQDIADWSCKLWKKGELRYGNSQTKYPCSDKPIRYISCDRGASRALYDLGFKEQTIGGWTTENMYVYLPHNGFSTITDWSKLEAGDIVEMTDGQHSAPCGNGLFHIFVIKSVHNGYIDKWDFGSDSRIQQGATFYNVPINGGKFEWAGAKSFFRAWRPNYKAEKGSFKSDKYSVNVVTFKHGAKNNSVRLAKRILIGRGYLASCGTNPTLCDEYMVKAIMSFQSDRISANDIRISSVNGIMDKGTWAALLSI